MNKAKMVLHLRRLSSGMIVPCMTDKGLCLEMEYRFNFYLFNCLSLHYHKWHEYSGNKIYPIKSNINGLDAKDCYIITPGKWSGEQGERRRRFCAWVADQIETCGRNVP